jgi:hypothetical protein
MSLGYCSPTPCVCETTFCRSALSGIGAVVGIKVPICFYCYRQEVEKTNIKEELET